MKSTMNMNGHERLARAAAFAQARRKKIAESSQVTNEHLPALGAHQQQASTCSEGFTPSTGSGALLSPYSSAGDTSQKAALITKASLERLRKERDALREANDILQEERAAAIAERAEALVEQEKAKSAEMKIQKQLDDVEKHVERLEAELKEALQKLREAAMQSKQKPEAPAAVLPVTPAAPAPLARVSPTLPAPKEDEERFCVDPCVMRNPLMGRSGGFAAVKAQDDADIRRLKRLLQDRDTECQALDEELDRMKMVVQKHESSAAVMGQKLRKVLSMMGKDVVARRLMVHIITPVVSLGAETLRGVPSRAKLERAVREEILPQCGDLLSDWESDDLPPGVSKLADQVTADLIRGLEEHMIKAEREAQGSRCSGPVCNVRLLREPVAVT
eukprot:gnl/MRDRNA2_/MRDRNA2_112185_c0_seq1.p1 gnl/MRDRNA2_/MRDRNA2_112185_c0~~gnl/MRDRNA2_/MRDRNA2_112185_c0_seq1.p1  ORF type:complete len:390 (-),score=110.09 gnl/MRDRNA2_/MRDRNA2_112185_c0_seq1:11-1180(-)